MKKVKGFTLIELMIVIAIIAIIAAIAIPGLLNSQRSANERNASGSLKTIGTSQVDFRSNDRDGNLVSDYWISDVQGLHAVPDAAGNPISLVEISVGRADNDVADPGLGYVGPLTNVAVAAKSGFWFEALENGEDTAGAAVAYGGGNNAPGRDTSRWGINAYADVYASSGNLEFIISEGNTMFKQDFGAQGPMGGGAMTFPNDPYGNNWSTLD